MRRVLTAACFFGKFLFGCLFLAILIVTHRSATLIAASESSKTVAGYDEYFDGDGQVRPIYRSFLKQLLNPRRRLRRKLMAKRPLKDDIGIFPIPLILSDPENELIVSGVKQRALAMALFFNDVVLGEGLILKDKTLDEALIREIFEDHGWKLDTLREIWKGKKLSDLNFVDGPDFAHLGPRDWAVIEHNVWHYVGGLSDVKPIRLAYLRKAFGLGKEKDSTRDPFETFLQAFKEKNRLDDKDVFVIPFAMAPPGPWEMDDKELIRENETIQNVFPGIQIVRENSLRRLSLFRHAPVFDWGDPTQLPKRFRASIYRPYSFHHAGLVLSDLVSRFRAGSFAVLFGIGTDVLGSKALLPFTETMIHYYLKQDPILRTQPTKLFDFKNPPEFENDELVLKRANGARGESVHIFKRLSHLERLRRLAEMLNARERERVRGFPAPLWVQQKYLDQSIVTLNNMSRTKFLSILRAFVFFNGGDIVAGDVPWGRVAPLSGSGLVNVSRGAYEQPVFIESELCLRSLDRLSAKSPFSQ